MQLLRANTEVIVRVGPFVDVGDGFTPQIDIDISGTNEAELLKVASVEVDISANTWTATANCRGWYDLTLTTDDTDTEGTLVVVVQDDSDCLPVFVQFMVMSAAAWDSMFIAKDDGFMDVNIKTVGRADTQETEANNLESACSNYSVTRGLTGTALPAAVAAAAGGVPVSSDGGLEMDTLADWVDAGRLDAILDAIATGTITDIPALIAIAQADLDTLTGSDGATLATAQGNYAPSKAGDLMGLVNDAITSAKYDESTAFPLAASDGSTLTAINLPNQTMNILGTITGNLIGDVTGKVDGTVAGKTPAEAGDAMTLSDGAIKAVSYDESTAFPVVASDAGVTQIARVGADGDTLETLSDEIATRAPSGEYDTEMARIDVVLSTRSSLAKLLAYVQLILRSDSAIETDNATELAEINSDGGSGAGDFSSQAEANEAIRDRGDAAWITGGGGGITDILNIQQLIPNNIDLANTVTIRLALGLTNMVDDLPTTGEITPGTISIDRKAIGGTSWSNIENNAACSEAAGIIYFDEVFDVGAGYAEGDSIRITFKNQKITVAANDYEITDGTGWVFQTSIRQTMRGTDSAALAATALTDATWTNAKAAFIDVSIASRSSHTAANVWAVGSRTLTSFGTLLADIWGYVTRTLTAIPTGGATETKQDLIQAEVDGLNGNAMRGTDGANTEVPDPAGTGAALAALIATAQADLDILTGLDGATLATAQGNYAPSKAGDEMALIDDAITAAKHDESTAFPVKSADTGSTKIARTGADSDTLETLSDQIDLQATAIALGVVDGNVDDIKAVTEALTVAAATKLAESAGTIVSASAITGTLSTTEMTTDLTEATNDHYNGRIIIWTSGVLKNQATDITAYDGAAKKLTFTAVTEAPSNEDTFIIV